MSHKPPQLIVSGTPLKSNWKIVGRWWNRSTRNLSPTQTTTALTESVWCNYFETLESAEGLQLPEDLVNYSWLWSISALCTVAAAHPQPCGKQLCMCFWSSLHRVCRSHSRQEGLYPLNIRDLSSDCSLLFLITEVQTKRWPATVTAPPPTVASPSLSSEVTSRIF